MKPKATAKGSQQSRTLYEQLEHGGLASLASMEGSWGEWTSAENPTEIADNGTSSFKGVVVSAIVMSLAWLIHRLPFAPFTIEGAAMEHPLGVSVLAIFIGIFIANIRPSLNVRSGCQWVTAWCIPAAVILLGSRMDLLLLQSISIKLFLVILGLMCFAVLLSCVVGKSLGMSKRASYLLGIGTAICGSSAILAVSPITEAEDEEVVVSVAVVNLVGLLAMFTCVCFLWLLPMNASLYGIWTGATIHAVPQVIAAAETHGPDAASMATLVKLTRVTLLVPAVLISLFLATRGILGTTRKNKNTSGQNISLYVPWFIWGFVGLAAIRACGWLPTLEFQPNNGETIQLNLSETFPAIAKWLLALSLAAIGLQVQIKPMLKAGARAFMAGIIVWLLMSILALACLFWLF